MRLRAIFAIAAICSVFFALLVSGAPHLSRDADGTHLSSRGHAALAVCHDYAVNPSKDAAAPAGGGKKRADCPCCLAAHAASAVLPERIAAAALFASVVTVAAYRAPADAPRRFALLQTVNGARAPPGGDTLS
jgi:hypothetical protein